MRLRTTTIGLGVAMSIGLASLAGCGEPAAELAAEEVAAAEPRSEIARAPSDLSLLEAPANVVASPGSEARVSASLDARVVAVHVRAGDRVEVGDPIVDVVMPQSGVAVAEGRVRKRPKQEGDATQADEPASTPPG